MLAYILALAVGLGSLGIYLAAFFFPEVHRKNDFIWSGVGLFYALVLWVCAGRITGSLLLGEVASVALLGWAVTQTLQLRRQLTPSQEQTLPNTEEVKQTVQEKISKLSLPQRLSQLGKRVTGSATTAKNRLQDLGDLNQQPSQVEQPTDSNATSKASTPQAEPGSRVQIIDNRTSTPEQPKPSIDEEPTQVKEALGSEPIPTNEPAEPDLAELSGKEAIPVEAIAPEIELVPPPTPEAMAAVPIETTPTLSPPPSESESSSADDVPEPVRPHLPDPELVEAAIEDAQEKHLPASPPETEDANSDATKEQSQ